MAPARFPGPASACGGARPGAVRLRGGGWAAAWRRRALRMRPAPGGVSPRRTQLRPPGWWAAGEGCEVAGLGLGPLTDVKRASERDLASSPAPSALTHHPTTLP